jgi:beta-1,4-mannooligosaccharide/beta-1,4-mannosyl-N-acetylglucosamine phosphorylase
VLSAADVTYEALLIFNAGVTRYQGCYVMVFRNDYGHIPTSPHPQHTDLGLAFARMA